MRLLAATLVLATFAAAPSRAGQEPPLLTAVDKCPAKAACVVVDIQVHSKEKDPSRVIRPTNSACGGKIFRVNGRLRGSAVRAYYLALQGSCLAACTDGAAAYYGRSARNAPIIATNLGRFEIVDDGVAVGAGADLIVIDETRGSVAKYLGNYAGSGDFYIERDRVYMRHDTGVCITAPQTRPGFLGIAAQRCRARADESGSVAFTDLAPASRLFLDRLFALNKAQRTTEEIVRDRMRRVGALIVVQPNDSCYQ